MCRYGVEYGKYRCPGTDTCGECLIDFSGYTRLCESCEDEISPRESDGFYECKSCGFYGTVYSPDYMKG